MYEVVFHVIIQNNIKEIIIMLCNYLSSDEDPRPSSSASQACLIHKQANKYKKKRAEGKKVNQNKRPAKTTPSKAKLLQLLDKFRHNTRRYKDPHHHVWEEVVGFQGRDNTNKALALSLYHTSPKCYRLLQKSLISRRPQPCLGHIW